MASSVLGIDTLTGERVTLARASRLRGTYIIGASGTGKSELIENLVIEDIKQGIGVSVLDPYGDLIQNILVRLPEHREQDVILLDLLDTEYPFGLNLLSCSDLNSTALVQRTVNQFMHILEKVC